GLDRCGDRHVREGSRGRPFDATCADQRKDGDRRQRSQCTPPETGRRRKRHTSPRAESRHASSGTVVLVNARKSFLSFAPPDIGEAEVSEIVDCLRSGWLTTGPRTARFETDFAAFVGANAALALNSGSAAIHCALKA